MQLLLILDLLLETWWIGFWPLRQVQPYQQFCNLLVFILEHVEKWFEYFFFLFECLCICCMFGFSMSKCFIIDEFSYVIISIEYSLWARWVLLELDALPHELGRSCGWDRYWVIKELDVGSLRDHRLFWAVVVVVHRLPRTRMKIWSRLMLSSRCPQNSDGKQGMSSGIRNHPLLWLVLVRHDLNSKAGVVN